MREFQAGGEAAPIAASGVPRAIAMRGIRSRLAMLVLVLLLPVWSFAGLVAWRMAETERAAIGRDGTEAARAVAAAVERDLTALTAALTALGTGAPGAPRDVQALQAQARALGTLMGVGLTVEPADPRAVPGSVSIGRFEIDTGSGAGRVPMTLALPEAGGQQLVLHSDAIGVWSAALGRVALPQGWIASVVDAEGRILARFPQPERLVGQFIHPDSRFVLASAASGWQRGVSRDGAPVDVAWRRVAPTGWTVLVGVPAGAVDGAFARALWPVLAGGALFALLVPLGISIWGARRIVRPLMALARSAASLGGPGLMVPPPRSDIREIDAVSRAIAAAGVERAEREAAREASEARLRSVLDHLTVGVALTDAESGRLLFINRRLVEILGGAIPTGTVLADRAEDWPAYTAEGRRLAVEERPLARAMRNGRPANADYRMRRADGKMIWLRVAAVPMRDQPAGASSAIVSVLVDVGDEYAAAQALGEQVEAEAAARREAMAAAAALAASEERFRRFAEASPDAVWIQSPAARTAIFVSPAAAQMSGLPLAQLVADPGAWAAQVAPEDREKLQQAMVAAAAGRPSEIEYRMRRADGTMIWLRDAAFPIRDTTRSPSPLRIGRLARDVTSRKEAETRQALLIAELNHRVKNTLATVLSIAQQTARGNGGQEGGLTAFLPVFRARIQALARGHDLLTASTWQGAELDALAESVLSPWRAGLAPRITLDGPALWLGPRQALALSLALHELATNAAKHGALSADSNGHAELSWQVQEAGHAGMRWREIGGPPVARPKHEGFGSRLLGRGLAAELGQGASVEVRYEKDGVVADIAFPIAAEENSLP
ncbi:MAG TPA: PAS domain S-box protein [Roseomonas sp.]|jgi:PAS domain S-box-containing protein